MPSRKSSRLETDWDQDNASYWSTRAGGPVRKLNMTLPPSKVHLSTISKPLQGRSLPQMPIGTLTGLQQMSAGLVFCTMLDDILDDLPVVRVNHCLLILLGQLRVWLEASTLPHVVDSFPGETIEIDAFPMRAIFEQVDAHTFAAHVKRDTDWELHFCVNYPAKDSVTIEGAVTLRGPAQTDEIGFMADACKTGDAIKSINGVVRSSQFDVVGQVKHLTDKTISGSTQCTVSSCLAIHLLAEPTLNEVAVIRSLEQSNHPSEMVVTFHEELREFRQSSEALQTHSRRLLPSDSKNRPDIFLLSKGKRAAALRVYKSMKNYYEVQKAARMTPGVTCCCRTAPKPRFFRRMATFALVTYVPATDPGSDYFTLKDSGKLEFNIPGVDNFWKGCSKKSKDKRIKMLKNND